jgi:hypothetical protein
LTEAESTLALKIKTDASRVTVIGKCVSCGEKVWSNQRYVTLHGFYFCDRHPLSKYAFEAERLLQEGGHLRLNANSSNRKERREIEKAKEKTADDVIRELIAQENSSTSTKAESP